MISARARSRLAAKAAVEHELVEPFARHPDRTSRLRSLLVNYFDHCVVNRGRRALSINRLTNRTSVLFCVRGEGRRNPAGDPVPRVRARRKTVGLSGLSIGRLAEETGLSKSGLFAHFGSKEALEVAVVEEAARQFVAFVMAPALRQPRGEAAGPRAVRSLDPVGSAVGRCFFVGAIAELGRFARGRHATRCPDLQGLDRTLATAARITVSEGHFRADPSIPTSSRSSLQHHARISHVPEVPCESVALTARAESLERLLGDARAPAARPR